MKGAIIYQSRYGATRKYAEMLAEALSLPVIREEEVNAGVLKLYDFFLIGSSVYVGKILLRKFLKIYESELKSKQLLFFIVSADTDPDLESHRKLIVENVPESFLTASEFFFLRGKVIYKELSWKDKLMLRMGAMAQKSAERKRLMMTDFDEVKKENLKGLINRVKQKMTVPSLDNSMQTGD